MKLEGIKNVITSKVGRQIVLGKKHSPAIMFGAGVVGIAGTVILACRATLRADEILDDADKHRIQLDEMLAREDYSTKDHKKDHFYLTVQTVAQVTKLYAPAFGLGVVSVALLTGAHVTLTKRNVALAAAYKAVEESLENYRGRVREELGEDREREIYRGVESRDIHDTNKGTVKQEKYINPGGGPRSPYSRFFGEDNVNWNPQPEYNLLFLRAVQSYANQQLGAKGYVLLNDIYDSLGMDRTREGCVVGWVQNGKKSDGFVDIGVFDGRNMDKFYEFIHGDEGIWLDFNVDGVVYDQI